MLVNSGFEDCVLLEIPPCTSYCVQLIESELTYTEGGVKFVLPRLLYLNKFAQ